jgi:hypothetical protein
MAAAGSAMVSDGGCAGAGHGIIWAALRASCCIWWDRSGVADRVRCSRSGPVGKCHRTGRAHCGGGIAALGPDRGR